MKVAVRILNFAWLSCAITACAAANPKPPEHAESPPASAPSAVAPAPAETPSTPGAPEAQAVSPPPAATATKSAYTISGSSISEVDAKTIQAALEKAGYGLIGPTESTRCGTLEVFQLGLTHKGKPAGILNLQRKGDDAKNGCVGSSPKEAFDSWKKQVDDPKSTTAMVYDEKADVLVALNLLKEGRGAAKALMEALVRKP